MSMFSCGTDGCFGREGRDLRVTCELLRCNISNEAKKALEDSNAADHISMDDVRRECQIGKAAGPSDDGPHVQILDMLTGSQTTSNPTEPTQVSTDFADASFLLLHKPEQDGHQAADYFHGKKRLWEMRLQFTFKVPLAASQIRMSCAPYERQKVGSAQVIMHRTLIGLVCKALSGLYNTPGDDPTGREDGDVERPETSVPFLEVDQYIEPSAGKHPSLMDPAFPTFGALKVTSPAKFRADLASRTFLPGETHTFAVWGPSFAVSLARWEFRTLPFFHGRSLDLGNGPPPICMTIYHLLPARGDDARHLEWRKQVFMRVAGWSSENPPTPERLLRLRPISKESPTQDESDNKLQLSTGREEKFSARTSSCCSGGICQFASSVRRGRR